MSNHHSDSSISKHKGRPTPGEVIEREEDLDEALDESFPASDPPSIVSPHRGWNGRGDGDDDASDKDSDA